METDMTAEMEARFNELNASMADALRHAVVRLPIEGGTVVDPLSWTPEDARIALNGLNALVRSFTEDFMEREKIAPCGSDTKIRVRK